MLKNNFLFLLILIFIFCSCQNKNASNTNNQNINKPLDYQQYNWSKLKDGPYQDSISYATSLDPLNWTDSQIILSEHATDPAAIIKNNIIYLYFIDVSQDNIPEQIGLLTSADWGNTWSDKQIIKINGLENKVPADLALQITEDNKIRLFYYDINEERIAFQTPSSMQKLPTHKTYSALSNYGINFQQEEGIRFEEDRATKKITADPAVIELPDGSYLKFYKIR